MKRLLYIFVWFITPAGNAQFSIAPVFSSNMLLQRDQPIPVWGKGIPGQTVELRLGDEVKSSLVEPDASWKIYLQPRSATIQPQTLTVSCGDTAVRFTNIIFGDSWICIGQSNMEWPLKKELHYPEEKEHRTQALIRLYNPTYAGKNVYATAFTDSVAARLTPAGFYTGNWKAADSNSAADMSAVAWYFARRLTASTGIPVGLINLSIGGAPLETFIDPVSLKQHPQFAAKVSGDWLHNPALPVWVRERGMQNTGGLTTIPADETGKNHAFKPGFAYTAGIVPLLQLPVKGILCYQGESNAQEPERVEEYAALFELLVNDYRNKWQQPELPFYFVQLSSIDTLKYKGQLWPAFRNQQRLMLQRIPFSGMAVSSDLGFRNDVHPTNKKEVGERLARWALWHTYKIPVIPSGPLPQKVVYKKGKLIVKFSYTAGGLMPSEGNQVNGFTLDGIPVSKLLLKKKKVIIPLAKRPAELCYGWQPFSEGNLVNSERLPASTFCLPVQ